MSGLSHLMANDYLRRARTGPRAQAVTSLASAFDYEKRVLSTCVFRSNPATDSDVKAATIPG